MIGYSFTGLAPRNLLVDFGDFTISAQTGPQIFKKYRVHYENKSELLPHNWEEIVWLKIKDAYPRYVSITPKKANTPFSLASAKSFFRFVKSGGLLSCPVDKSEAERRAAVCRSCPLSANVSACPFCKAALSRFKKDQSIDVPDGCRACGCYMPAKIWIKREYLGSADDFEFHPCCWMRD